jgi:hypothetical protein
MKKKLLLLSLTFSMLYAAGQQTDTAGYFEGYIDFKNEYKSLIPGVSDNEFRDRFGEFLRIYYKDGNFKWVFTDNAGYTRSYQLTLQKTHTEYLWNDAFPDTLFTTDLSDVKRTLVDSIAEITPDTVLGCACSVVNISGSTAFNESYAESIPAFFTYYFCPFLRINPDHYEKFKNFRWNEITKKYRSVAIKMISQYGAYVIGTFTAIKINHGLISMTEFAIDRSKIIKPAFPD